MAKPKIALYWCSSCGGCEESVVDLAEDLLMVAEKAEIVFWPVAMDFKYRDVESLPDGEISLTLINGSIRMEEQEKIARLLRKKSKLIMAHGSCAHLGGVFGLANFFEKREILDKAYAGILPGQEFYASVKALNQVIEVDYYIPGCPPTPELIKKALMSVIEDRLLPKGSVMADKRALCDTCSRRDSKPDKIKLERFKRLHETEWDAARCFLDQELVCLGPVTRGGCGERCIKANMPCRGCFGPTDGVTDYGAKSVSFLASIIGMNDAEKIKQAMGSIPDPAGLFYRYSLPSSLLRGKIEK